MNLEIDYRESDLIEIIKNQAIQHNIEYKVCNLIIGDFIIKNGDDILFVIERKSIKDLCASIIDTRFREQKQRILESIKDPSKIIYIIEGKKEASQTITKKTINSAIINLIFKHKFHVLFTDSKQDTFDNLLLLYTKLQNNDLQLDLSLNSTLTNVHLVKKSDKINNHIFINMLSIIPGVSIKIAIKIHEHYHTLHDLIKSYNNIEDEELQKTMLSNIFINTNRKLGKVLSEKIYHSIMTSH